MSLTEKIEYAMKKNYDIYLQKSENINYEKICLIWNKNKKRILKLKTDDIIEEINEFISENNNTFVKLVFEDQNNKTITQLFLNKQWNIVDTNLIS
jgi:ribulose bisphosphate carboxylase small subunit